MISDVIPLAPSEIRINRARSGRGRNSRQYAEAKETFAADVRSKLRELRARGAVFPIDGPVTLHIALYMPHAGRFEGIAKGDADGPLKGLKDALKKAGVYHDDEQVVRLTVEKHLDPQNPRVSYRVERFSR